MFEYIKGYLAEASPTKVTLEVNNIGYGFFIPLSVYAKLPQIGKEITLFISTVIREDSHKSYGFLTRFDRDFFEKLTDISGIGPKTAISLIGHIDIADFQEAISQGNTALIAKVPGIGKKTAERLIVEMKDKTLNISSPGKGNSMKGDAISALMNLGYSPLHAQKAVNSVYQQNTDLQLSELITLALQTPK